MARGLDKLRYDAPVSNSQVSIISLLAGSSSLQDLNRLEKLLVRATETSHVGFPAQLEIIVLILGFGPMCRSGKFSYR